MNRYDDKWIVLTGGAGFIGSSLLRHLNDLGISNIAVVDELGKGEKWKNLVGKKFGEAMPPSALFDWLEGREEDIEAFIHLGACSATTEQDASYLLENNYRYTVRLCEYAMWHNHRFIYASSAATYGNGEFGYSDDHDLLDSLAPMNMYGYSKHLFDLWAKRQGILDRVVGLKYFNVYGPNEYHKGSMASAILKLVPQVQQEGVIRLFKSNTPEYGDGEQKRDFIYVKDAVRMTADFLQNRAGGIFNIGTGEATSWNQLGRAVGKALNQEVRIEYIDMPQVLVGAYQNYSCADMSKHTHHPDLNPAVMPFEEAVADYVQGYLLPAKRW